MAKVYAYLIIKGAINPKTGKPYTINDVPDRIKDQVKEVLIDLDCGDLAE